MNRLPYHNQQRRKKQHNPRTRRNKKQRRVKLHPTTFQVYRFVYDYWQRKHCSPTFREIGEGIYTGHSSVYRHIDKLVGMGWLEREDNRPRSIILGELAPDPDTILNPHDADTEVDLRP